MTSNDDSIDTTPNTTKPEVEEQPTSRLQSIKDVFTPLIEQIQLITNELTARIYLSITAVIILTIAAAITLSLHSAIGIISLTSAGIIIYTVFTDAGEINPETPMNKIMYMALAVFFAALGSYYIFRDLLFLLF